MHEISEIAKRLILFNIDNTYSVIRSNNIQNKQVFFNEDFKNEIIDVAIDCLGLSHNTKFKPEEKILEVKIKKEIL